MCLQIEIDIAWLLTALAKLARAVFQSALRRTRRRTG